MEVFNCIVNIIGSFQEFNGILNHMTLPVTELEIMIK